MKKLILMLTMIFFVVAVQAQSEFDKWRVGFRFSPSFNFSTFQAEGMASGRFELKPYQTALAGITLRRHFGQRWFLESGYHRAKMGFRTSFALDYSTTNGGGQPVKIEQTNSYSFTHIPLTLGWNGKYNCRHWRTVLKAGVSAQIFMHNATVLSLSPIKDQDGKETKLTYQDQVNPFSQFGLVFGIGREKKLKKGGLFYYGISAILNLSPESLFATVSYQDAGVVYVHRLANSGSLVSFDISYFLPGSLLNKLKKKKNVPIAH